MEWRIESSFPGLAWPAVPGPAGAAALALLFQLEDSQWLAPERLRAHQQAQLDLLLHHACMHVPYYRERLGSVPPSLERIPMLTRRALMEHFEALKSRQVPPAHGAIAELRTSGSTGEPVRVSKTQLSQLVWNALTLREHRWHRRELGAKLAAIRLAVGVGDTPSWGGATDGTVRTGPGAAFDPGRDVREQLDWLQGQRAQYLLTYPSNAQALAELSLARGIALPGLREVRTFGESLAPDLRALVREAWDVPVVDVYSANEVGYIALQCPAGEGYHVQSESLIVEVLDEHGRPCAPGELGRIVVTDLHNFATPLIRYEIGDYAEVAPPCACGRGLPALSRIAGRVRNMLVTADGRRFWPRLNSRRLRDIAPVLQHQAVQKEFDLVELRLVSAAPLDARQEADVRALVLSVMPPGMRLAFAYCDEIARGPAGKFEDFICAVAR